MLHRSLAASLFLSVLTIAPVRGQEVTVEELLQRIGDYVLHFNDQFSNVVAEEVYEQETTTPRRKRTLKSDFLLVRFPGATRWLAFRDVIEVDGKRVQGETDRLAKLFLEPPDNAMRRANDIARESARHNLSYVGTINQPLLVMAFLQPDYQEHFHFNLAGRETDLGADVRIVRFKESRSPTLLKGNANSDLPSQGLVWVEESSGRVRKTQLDLGRAPFGVRIVTTFGVEPELGIDVPVEMRDVYPSSNAGELHGVATYGRFRRFDVRTSESVN